MRRVISMMMMMHTHEQCEVVQNATKIHIINIFEKICGGKFQDK